MTASQERNSFRPQPPPLIFAGVLLMRAIALARFSGSPFLLPSAADMHFYDQWACRILAGEWSNHLAFYGLPGYAYLLAALYKIAGHNPFFPALLQAALDAGTAVLIYKISISVFAGLGRPIAVSIGTSAAIGWAFFVPAQAYSIILMPTSWAVFVFWFVVWFALRDKTAPATLAGLSLGLLIGLTATAVATILFLLPLVAWMLLKKGEARKPVLARLAAFVLLLVGLAAGTAPCWLHNYFIAHDPVLLSAHSGINFWIGNNPTANGYPHFPPGLRAGQTAMLADSIAAAEKAAGRPLSRGEVSHYWSAKAWAFIREQPRAWFELLALKLRNLWNAFQYDDLSVITILREEGIIVPGIYFGLVAALGLPGLVFAWKEAPRSRWVTAAIGLHSSALLPVFATERYRLAIVPGLLIFAAFSLVLLWQQLALAQFRRALAFSGLVLVSALFVSWPQRDSRFWALDAYNSGRQALEGGNLGLARKKLELARAYAPSNPEINFAIGNLELAEHDEQSAITAYLTTLQLDPGHRGALNNLGVLALQLNRYSEAEKWLRRAEEIDPRNSKTHFLLAKTLLAKNEPSAARDELETALQLTPDQPEFNGLKHQLDQNSP